MSRKQVIKENQVSQLHTFLLGGYEQKVLIEGKRKDLPVVITLHGGPGTPIPFSVGCRGLFPVFTDRCIMVYWDQLGCGINNHRITDDFSIQSFVEMTVDLLRQIHRLFPENPKYLFATSWGSILSAKVAAQYPQLVDGVIANGQIIKNVFFNGEVMDALRKANIPQKKLRQLQNASPEKYTPSDLQTLSACLRKYTNAYQNKQGESSPVGKIILGLLTSPDYRFQDFKAMMINGYQKNNSLWAEILKLDLSETLSQVQIPYFIFQGDTDIVASTAEVKRLVEAARNPNLQCKVVANTGHLPGAAMMEAIFAQFVACFQA